jgi:ABC-type nitrate/sulfonate/bicarbonate transport system permease component
VALLALLLAAWEIAIHFKWIAVYLYGRPSGIFAKASILIANGELSGRVTATLLACIPVLAAIPLGTWLRDKVSVRGFDLAIIAMLPVSAIALCNQTFV